MFDSYISLSFIGIFLPVVISLYQLCKKEYRWIILLLASLFFFISISNFLVIYFFISSIVVYLAGRKIETIGKEKKEAIKEVKNKEEKKMIKQEYVEKQNHILHIGLVFSLGILIVLKYSGLFYDSFLSLLRIKNHITYILLPIGISFYTLEEIAYMIDIRDEKIEAEKNYFYLLTFLTYFPKLMEGPITRYRTLKDDLLAGNPITSKNLVSGMIRIGYGIMKKLIVSDRLNYAILTIYKNYNNYDGSIILLAGIFYTIQLYFEFSGTMDVVIGTSEIFDIHLKENFRQPFFSTSISEFWQRWHISLGSFFKDYVYYPLSMSAASKKMTLKLRKKLGNYYSVVLVGGFSLFVVWFLNGWWHGAGYQYLAFGMYHFILLFTSNLCHPILEKIHKIHLIQEHPRMLKRFQQCKTTFLVCIGELIFRSDSLSQAKVMLVRLFTHFNFESILNHMIYKLQLDIQDILVVVVMIFIVYSISKQKEKGVKIRETIFQLPLYQRYMIYYGMIIMILLLGAYGNNYVPLDPIYASF